MGENLLILRGGEVCDLLRGREGELLDLVAAAYRTHGRGDSSLPHSTFLRFPEDPVNRIIALPAYLGGGVDAAGMKWIASFPANVDRGMERASAVMILNSTATGRPTAILEASTISARRTAASAALAARELCGTAPPAALGLIGTGLINFEVARFVDAALPGLERVVLFDLSRERAEALGKRLEATLAGVRAEIAPSLEALLSGCALVSFATTAVEPHVSDLSACPPGAVVLHVSLRDLSAATILSCDNVVDDVDHVMRAGTSVHLAEQRSGRRDFIRCTLAEILEGTAPEKQDPGTVTIFSPFGLGVLDLAVAHRVAELARESNTGAVIDSFLS